MLSGIRYSMLVVEYLCYVAGTLPTIHSLDQWPTRLRAAKFHAARRTLMWYGVTFSSPTLASRIECTWNKVVDSRNTRLAVLLNVIHSQSTYVSFSFDQPLSRSSPTVWLGSSQLNVSTA